MRNNPALVAEAIDLSRHTVHKIHQNLPRWTGAAALPRCGAWVKTTAR